MTESRSSSPQAQRIGHVCFRGPQNFLGYISDADATARTLSSDGCLYTSDMGFIDRHGLHFSGRVKWVLKPAGYQVFPSDIENHLSQLSDKVATVGRHGLQELANAEVQRLRERDRWDGSQSVEDV
jgi:acyl-CoA synthetase (AMP-forming)/AMP-acid ligase II